MGKNYYQRTRAPNFEVEALESTEAEFELFEAPDREKREILLKSHNFFYEIINLKD